MYFGLRQIAAPRPAGVSMDTFCLKTGILRESGINQKRKAKISRRPGLSSSGPPGFIKNLHPRASGSIFNKKPDIPSRLPCGMSFLFSVFFWGNAYRMHFTGWLKLWLRQQMSKRGADGRFVGWPGSVKVSGKKFFTAKKSNKRKKVFARNPKGLTLTVREGKLSLTMPKFMTTGMRLVGWISPGQKQNCEADR